MGNNNGEFEIKEGDKVTRRSFLKRLGRDSALGAGAGAMGVLFAKNIEMQGKVREEAMEQLETAATGKNWSVKQMVDYYFNALRTSSEKHMETLPAELLAGGVMGAGVPLTVAAANKLRNITHGENPDTTTEVVKVTRNLSKDEKQAHVISRRRFLYPAIGGTGGALMAIALVDSPEALREQSIAQVEKDRADKDWSPRQIIDHFLEVVLKPNTVSQLENVGGATFVGAAVGAGAAAMANKSDKSR